MNYCAVIGDLVASKEISARKEAQSKFKNVIAEINDKYKEELVAELMIYAGDEVQGLLATPAFSYKLIQDLKQKLYPLKVVFGVGIGSLAMELPANPITWELDGSAYHQARQMVEQAKKKKPTICYSFAQAVVKRDGIGELINSLLYFIESNQANRTQRQQQIVKLYQQYQSQSIVAEELGISQVAVSKVLNNALYYQVQQAEASLNRYLNSFN